MSQNWGAWTPYEPTIDAMITGTTDPVLSSNGSHTSKAAYQQNGVWVIAHGEIVFGNTGVNAGDGVYCPTLPVPARADRAQILGVGYVTDASDDTLIRVCSLATVPSAIGGDNFVFVLDQGKMQLGSGLVGSSVPWTWAAGDSLLFQVEYEAATS